MSWSREIPCTVLFSFSSSRVLLSSSQVCWLLVLCVFLFSWDVAEYLCHKFVCLVALALPFLLQECFLWGYLLSMFLQSLFSHLTFNVATPFCFLHFITDRKNACRWAHQRRVSRKCYGLQVNVIFWKMFLVYLTLCITAFVADTGWHNLVLFWHLNYNINLFLFHFFSIVKNDLMSYKTYNSDDSFGS